MTIHPNWSRVKCPTCNARPLEPCTAVLTLPKGTTLARPHAGRLLAYEQTQSSNKQIRDSGQSISSVTNGNGTISS